VFCKLNVVTRFGEQMESKTFLYTTCPAPTLLGVTASNVDVNQPRQLPFLVIPDSQSLLCALDLPHLLLPASVNDTRDVWNSHTCFCDVGRYC
jgi:hypothetical protein